MVSCRDVHYVFELCVCGAPWATGSSSLKLGRVYHGLAVGTFGRNGFSPGSPLMVLTAFRVCGLLAVIFDLLFPFCRPPGPSTFLKCAAPRRAARREQETARRAHRAQPNNIYTTNTVQPSATPLSECGDSTCSYMHIPNTTLFLFPSLPPSLPLHILLCLPL